MAVQYPEDFDAELRDFSVLDLETLYNVDECSLTHSMATLIMQDDDGQKKPAIDEYYKPIYNALTTYGTDRVIPYFPFKLNSFRIPVQSELLTGFYWLGEKSVSVELYSNDIKKSYMFYLDPGQKVLFPPHRSFPVIHIGLSYLEIQIVELDTDTERHPSHVPLYAYYGCIGNMIRRSMVSIDVKSLEFLDEVEYLTDSPDEKENDMFVIEI